MRILYVNHYAGSLTHGMEFRPYYLAKEWEKMGHETRILAASFSHLRKKNPIVEHQLQIDTIDGIEYQWVKTKKYEGNGINRALNMAEFVKTIWLRASSIVKDFKPDVIISSSCYPLDTYATQKMAKKSGALLIHEVHDMWPITPIELYGMSPKNPFIVAIQMAENSFCKNADLVVSILSHSKEYLIQHGMKPEHFFHIPNGINISDWDMQDTLDSNIVSKIDQAHSEGRFVISFFGSHTKAYGLDTMLDALTLIDPHKIYMVFVGNGNYKNELIDKAKLLKLDLSSYGFFDPIPKSQIPSLIEKSDASYVGAVRSKIFRFGIGMNKLYDAMMGGRPIVYAVEAPNNYIEEYQCGISVEPENSKALADGICRMMNMSEDDRLEMGKRGRKAVLDNFTYPILANEFIEAITLNSKMGDKHQ